ncbi:unnamed protein product [Arabis nemorensis]|uniref:Uncharacterized protein n=1 Tax=Arabis nemorensis TaxID=586526 RepID=A0A565BRG9_9BRAS|nr:unnamed protein product [Arabis nemorensis]
MATPPPPVNLWTVLSESKRIINAHSRHFLALSVLFLLPNSFCIALYPSVSRLITPSDNQPPRADPDYKTTVLLLTAYVVIITVFNLLAIGSIVYSVFQGFYGRPVKFISAMKSSFASFFPLLATLITTNSIVLGIFLVLGFYGFLLKTLIEIIIPGLEISFLAFLVIVMIISSIIVIKFQLDWYLSWIIVVVESVWGLTPLKRSKSLTKGMKIASLSIIFFFAIAQLPLWWINNAAASIPIENGRFWTIVYFVFQIVIASAFLMFSMLYHLAATTVMYVYCKVHHGEVDSERNYVSLPFDDDGKVQHLVSVAHNNV